MSFSACKFVRYRPRLNHAHLKRPNKFRMCTVHVKILHESCNNVVPICLFNVFFGIFVDLFGRILL